jgi:hypothetical protein
MGANGLQQGGEPRSLWPAVCSHVLTSRENNMPVAKQTKSDLKRLKTLRDEVKVQAHLFDTEMRTRWKKFEKDWKLIQSETRRIAPEATKVFSESVKLTKPLFSRIEKSLGRIQAGIERHHKKTQTRM